MVRNNRNRGFFEQLERRVENNLARGMKNQRAHSLAQAFKSTEEFHVNQKENRVQLRRLEDQEEEDRVIDLKQGFKRSPKAKSKEGGGWYLVVPIRLYTSRSKHRDSEGMSNRLYQDLNSHKLGEGEQSRTVVSDYLYDNRRGTSSAVQELQYTPKTQNITKMQNDSMTGRGSKYIAFRTVSDKSHPASWVINRQKVNPFDYDNETKRIIDEVVEYNRRENRKLAR